MNDNWDINDDAADDTHPDGESIPDGSDGPDAPVAGEQGLEEGGHRELAPESADSDSSTTKTATTKTESVDADFEDSPENAASVKAQSDSAEPATMGAEPDEPDEIQADEAEQKVEQRQATKPAKHEPKGEPQTHELSEEQLAYPWYVVHTYSGYEQRAKLTLEERVKTAGAFEKFGQIVVPHEKVVELVRGEKKTTSKKVFPGYILVQCILDDETWHIVKATPKITGFVGDSRNPVPLTKDEVDNLRRQMEGEGQRARPSVQFEQGDSIKVIDGPFAEFNGTVDEVKPDKGKLRVLISIFGRNTPVELDFVQVEKV